MSDHRIFQELLGREKESGFSLLEVMVAIFIMTTALIGIMTLISFVISSSGLSSARLIGANLAQEGIEISRSIRDLSANGNGWSDIYSAFPSDSEQCQGSSGGVDFLTQYNDVDGLPYQDIPLKYDSVTNLYGYDSGVDTPFNFKRKVTICKPEDYPHIFVVTVSVTWEEHGRPGSITVQDLLWDWW